MKKSVKIIAAVAALTAAITAVSKYFCDFAMKKGNNGFQIKGGFRADKGIVTNEQQKVIDILHNRQKKYKNWFLVEAENINVMTNNGVKVHGLLVKAEERSHKYALLCHGYKECADDMGYQAYKFRKMGYNVIAVDGRGSGKTDGKYIGMGWLEHKDLCGFINYVLSQDAQAQILLYGVSMGAAEVMMTAGEKLPVNVKAIVEDCGYTSVWDEFAYSLRSIFHLPPVPLLNCISLYSKLVTGVGFKEASAVKALKTSKIPILMIHGSDDDFVPFEMLDELYEAAAGEKEKLVVKGAKHIQSDIIAPELYWTTIKNFSDKYVK